MLLSPVIALIHRDLRQGTAPDSVPRFPPLFTETVGLHDH